MSDLDDLERIAAQNDPRVPQTRRTRAKGKTTRPQVANWRRALRRSQAVSLTRRKEKTR